MQAVSSEALTLKRHLVDVVLGSLGQLADDLADLPSMENIANELAYNRPLFKRLLLKWPGRAALSRNITERWKAFAATSKLCEAFQLGDGTETDLVFGDATLSHTAMFESAKKAVMLTAPVNIVQGLTQRCAVQCVATGFSKVGKLKRARVDSMATLQMA